jgi:hypothetical protein
MEIQHYLEVNILEPLKEIYGDQIHKDLIKVSITQDATDVYLDCVYKGDKSDLNIIRDNLKFVYDGEYENEFDDDRYFNSSKSVMVNADNFVYLGSISHLNISGGLLFKNPHEIDTSGDTYNA